MNVRYCERCKAFFGGGAFKIVDSCIYCEGDVIERNISCDDVDVLYEVTPIDNFETVVEAMISLKEKDVIEYELKMSQFRNQVGQQKQIKAQLKPSNLPKCPRCGSTAITAGQRGWNLMWGFIGSSDTVNRCSNCGHKWKPRK